MKHTIDKNSRRLRIHVRIRRAVKGSNERPRLAVFRSLKHIYAQLIDDHQGRTVVSASSNEADAAIIGGNLAGAKAIGKLMAERAIAAGVKKVVFDRGGFKYSGRVKALADGAREGGLEF